MKDHVDRKQFLLEFFGPLGRELGDPLQHYTDDPTEIFEWIEKCAKEKKPAFISVQPRSAHGVVYGLEKLFFDFDYGRKSDKFTERQIKKHWEKMENEVKIFLAHLEKMGIIPLVVKTRKGYHVYIYFDRVYQIDNDENFWCKVYGVLYERFIRGNRHEYVYVDKTSKEDIKRLCRIPTSIHQKTGEPCPVLDTKLRKTKFRSIEYYKMYGLKRDDLIDAVNFVRCEEEKRKKSIEELRQQKDERWERVHGFTGDIRPCFRKRMEAGEMCHQQRLALLIEAYYAGYRTREEMIELFKCFNDFNEKKTREQVDWFFENKVEEAKERCDTKPYRCDTIQEKGWCLKSECGIYRKRIERNGKTERKKT